MLGFISKFNGSVITTSPSRDNVSTNYTKFRGLNQPSSDTFVKNNTTEPIKANNSISFKGGFKVPIKEIEQFNKKYFKSLKKMSKEDIIKDNCMTYSNKVRQITQKFDPTAEDYAAKKDFYADYTHELFGSFIGTQQYRLMMLPEDATHEDAMKPMYTVAKHITDTLKRYQECIDKGLDNPNIATPVNKAWELTKECLQEKVKSKNITLHIENEELINNPEFNTHFGYKNYAIMSNILENATKYSPENSHIHAAFKMKDGNIHLTVKDHGRGILPEEQESVVEGMTRGSNVQDISGTGYGLFRINSILKEHRLPYLKITSPLYPEETINKGTQIDVPLLKD